MSFIHDTLLVHHVGVQLNVVVCVPALFKVKDQVNGLFHNAKQEGFCTFVFIRIILFAERRPKVKRPLIELDYMFKLGLLFFVFVSIKINIK